MSHETDSPGLRSEGRSTPEDPAQKGLFGRLTAYLAEWPRRYVAMRVDALDPDR